MFKIISIFTLTAIALSAKGSDEAMDFIKNKGGRGGIDPLVVLTDFPRKKVEQWKFFCNVILNYKEDYIPTVLSVINDEKDPDYGNYGDNAFFIVRALMGGDEKQLSFEVVKNIIDRTEAEFEREFYFERFLNSAYLAMGESNFPQALGYLKERASFEYWEGRKMPRSINRKDEYHGDYIDGAWSSQGYALWALGMYPKPEAEAFLKACLNDLRYSEDEYLATRIKIALSQRPAELERYEISQAAWKKRAELLKANGTVNGIQDTQPAATSPTQPVGTTSPLSSTSNSPKAQSNSASSLSSSTPLFILGILAVVVGLFVFLRRK